MPFATIQSFESKQLVTGPNTITITFDRPVTGFNLTDMTLTRGATGGNLLGAGQTLTTTDGGTTWVLSGVGPITTRRGTYNLAITPAGASGIRDANGNAALPQKRQFYVNGTPTELRAQPVDGGEIDLTW